MSATPAHDPGTSDGRCAALLAANPPDCRRVRLALRRGLDLHGDQGVSWKMRVALWSAALFVVLFWLFLVIGRRL
jgi:hypothetical protein